MLERTKSCLFVFLITGNLFRVSPVDRFPQYVLKAVSVCSSQSSEVKLVKLQKLVLMYDSSKCLFTSKYTEENNC